MNDVDESVDFSDDTSPQGSAPLTPPGQAVDPLDKALSDVDAMKSPEKTRFPVSFIDLFKDNRRPLEACKCSFVSPSDSDSVEIPKSEVANIKDIWGYCLLGCFVGRFPGLKALQSLVDSWKVKCSIMAHYNGWILFQFKHEDELNKVLAEGPYFVFGRSLLLRTPPENFCFLEEDFSIVPVWVQLHNLPLQCWTIKAISTIASKLGKPLCTDRITQERKRISYARVLVELDASKSPCEQFEVTLPSGITYTQYVEYENMPKYCKYCHMFNHFESSCKFKKQDETDARKKMNPEYKEKGPDQSLNPSGGKANEINDDNEKDKTTSPTLVNNSIELLPAPVQGSNSSEEDNSVSPVIPGELLLNRDPVSITSDGTYMVDIPFDENFMQEGNGSNPAKESASIDVSNSGNIKGSFTDNPYLSLDPCDEEGFQTVAKRKNKGRGGKMLTIDSIIARSNSKGGSSKQVHKAATSNVIEGGGGAPKRSSYVDQ